MYLIGLDFPHSTIDFQNCRFKHISRSISNCARLCQPVTSKLNACVASRSPTPIETRPADLNGISSNWRSHVCVRRTPASQSPDQGFQVRVNLNRTQGSPRHTCEIVLDTARQKRNYHRFLVLMYYTVQKIPMRSL